MKFVIMLFVLVTLVADFSSESSAGFLVSGNINGTVGGESLIASLSGTLDENTWSGSESVSFSKIPSQLVANYALPITITFYKCQVGTRLPECSIFVASNGNYSVNREWSFNGSSTPEMFVSATTSTVGENLSFDATVTGAFPVFGKVALYNALITPNGAGSALESISVQFESGQTATSTGLYTWTGPGLTMPATVSVSWSNETFAGNTFSDDFTTTSTCVPEPSTLAIFGTGITSIISCFGWRRRK